MGLNRRGLARDRRCAVFSEHCLADLADGQVGWASGPPSGV